MCICRTYTHRKLVFESIQGMLIAIVQAYLSLLTRLDKLNKVFITNFIMQKNEMGIIIMYMHRIDRLIGDNWSHFALHAQGS